MEPKQPRPILAVITIAAFAVMMLLSVVVLDISAHIPMLLGTVVAVICAMVSGMKWQEIEESMVQGITQAISAIIILMLIGILIGVWIISGVVPTMVYYGLKLLTPRFFLASAMLLCAVISMAVGSWGTAGTVGLALMGIAQAMGIPAPIAAGAVISGAYFGDKVSPLSDSTNLASAVSEVDIFDNVRYMFPVSAVCMVMAGVIYFLIGLQFDGGGASMAGVQELMAAMGVEFVITPISFLPLALMIFCVLRKVPSIPGIVLGILSAGLLGVFLQGTAAAEVLASAYKGYESFSGNETLDVLLTAGGLEAMMEPVSMILCAMIFGGVMEGSGMMQSLMQPLLTRLKSRPSLVTATVFCCIGVNAVLPEQYIAIALPGRLFAKAYDDRGVERVELCRALGAGGSSFSAQIPWNTCGVFMAGVLGVSAFQYGPYAFLNLLMAPMTIIFALKPGRKKLKQTT